MSEHYSEFAKEELATQKGSKSGGHYYPRRMQVRAIQWTGNNYDEVIEFFNHDKRISLENGEIILSTRGFRNRSDINDWIVTNDIDIYPVWPHRFHEAYVEGVE